MIELIIAAIGALGAVTTAVLKTVSQKSQASETVTVTVQRGGKQIERQATMRAADASRLLDMVTNEVKPATVEHR
jgi:hypothetical protein